MIKIEKVKKVLKKHKLILNSGETAPSRICLRASGEDLFHRGHQAIVFATNQRTYHKLLNIRYPKKSAYPQL